MNRTSDSHQDTQSYYDDFSCWYERERHHGYHALIDDLEFDLLRPWASGRDVLDLGCGTGLTLERIAPLARRAVGIDISQGMLEKAAAKGLEVHQADASSLPFDEASFDLLYSFKVLAHVEAIEQTLIEMERVVRPGGHLFLEFYNPYSLRYLAKLARKGKISEERTEAEVYTRYDSLSSVRAKLPEKLRLVDWAGVRVFTPFAAVHRIPLLGRAFSRLEWWGRDGALRGLGGFLVVHLRRV